MPEHQGGSSPASSQNTTLYLSLSFGKFKLGIYIQCGNFSRFYPGGMTRSCATAATTALNAAAT